MISSLTSLFHSLPCTLTLYHQFKEHPITFGPTFKVKRAVGTTYGAQRTPSYCDRILYYSAPDREGQLEVRVYSSNENISTSDHKPVYAIMDVRPMLYPNFTRGIVIKDESSANMADLEEYVISFPRISFQGINDESKLKRRLFLVVYGPDIFFLPPQVLKPPLPGTSTPLSQVIQRPSRNSTLTTLTQVLQPHPGTPTPSLTRYTPTPVSRTIALNTCPEPGIIIRDEYRTIQELCATDVGLGTDSYASLGRLFIP